MVRSAAFALSLSSEVKSIGAYAGFAAIIGLALLTLLYFAAARELRRLRETIEQPGGVPAREPFAPRAATRAVATPTAAAPAAPPPGPPLATPSVPGTRRVAVPAGVIAAAPPAPAAASAAPKTEVTASPARDGVAAPVAVATAKPGLASAPSSDGAAKSELASAPSSDGAAKSEPASAPSSDPSKTEATSGAVLAPGSPATGGSTAPAREDQPSDAPPAIAPSTAVGSAPPAGAAPAREKRSSDGPPVIAPSTAVGSAPAAAASTAPAREDRADDAPPAIAPSTAAAGAARASGEPAGPSSAEDPFSLPPRDAPKPAPPQLDHDEPLPSASGARAPAVGLASTPAPSRVFDFDDPAAHAPNGPLREQDAQRRVPIPTRPTFPPPPPQGSGAESTVRGEAPVEERTVRGGSALLRERPQRSSLRERASELRGGDLGGVATWKLALAAALVVVLIVLAVSLLGGGGSTPASHRRPASSATASHKPAAAPARGSVTVVVLNGTHTTGLAATVARQLGADGYVKGSVGNAPDQAHTATIVAYTAGGRPAAIEVAHSLGLTSVSVAPADSATRTAASAAGGTAQVIVTVGANLVQ